MGDDMNQKDFLMKELNLTKQNTKTHEVYTGKVDGYFTVVEMHYNNQVRNYYTIKIGAQLAEADDGDITLIKDTVKEQYSPRKVDILPSIFYVEGNIPLRSRKVQQIITGIITIILESLSTLKIGTGDFKTGDLDSTVSLYNVDNRYLFLSDKNYEQVKQDLHLDTLNDSKNLKTIQSGIFGALLGALAGALLWGLLLYFGYYSWFAAMIGVYLAFYLYRKNNGLMSLTGIISVLGLIVSTLVASNFITYSFVLYQELKVFGFSFFAVLLNIVTILRELELSTPFFIDLAVGVGLAILFSSIYAYRLYNVSKNENKITKV